MRLLIQLSRGNQNSITTEEAGDIVCLNSFHICTSFEFRTDQNTISLLNPEMLVYEMVKGDLQI